MLSAGGGVEPWGMRAMIGCPYEERLRDWLEVLKGYWRARTDALGDPVDLEQVRAQPLSSEARGDADEVTGLGEPELLCLLGAPRKQLVERVRLLVDGRQDSEEQVQAPRGLRSRGQCDHGDWGSVG